MHIYIYILVLKLILECVILIKGLIPFFSCWLDNTPKNKIFLNKALIVKFQFYWEKPSLIKTLFGP